MKDLFLFSGLGADQRVFEFLDLAQYKLHHIQWIPPLKHEPIESYAKRILTQITIDKPVLIGVSFGGMMAIEVAKLIPTEKVILISSARTRSDLPVYYRLAGRLRLQKLVPRALLKKTNPLLFWLFGTESKQEKDLLRSIIRDTDINFLQWAIDKIVTWQNKDVVKNTISVYGTKDRLLPSREGDHRIDKGGHLMIVNRAVKISGIIKQLL
jgi:pimeloyl-ACP methyl ester carboxylesterase